MHPHGKGNPARRRTLTSEFDALQNEWLSELKKQGTGADHRISESELGQQGRELLQLLSAAVATGTDIQAEPWRAVREFLDGCRARARAGLHVERDGDVRLLAEEAAVQPHPRGGERRRQRSPTRPGRPPSWSTRSALHTVATFQKTREDVIARQQEEMLELSTPVVKLWDGVLALPMIGTLDSARTQVVMESLLQRIVETGSEIAIIDITGVPTVDTLVAQHLLKTVTAIRLMGADCIISGIRPQIAQTIVHLGVDLRGRDHQGHPGRRAGAGAQAQRA